MKRTILVGVSLPHNDYRISLDPKGARKMHLHGWSDLPECESALFKKVCNETRSYGWGWVDSLELDSDLELPDTLHVIVWFTDHGWGYKWGVSKVFISESDAASYLERYDNREWTRLWVVPVNRFK